MPGEKPVSRATVPGPGHAVPALWAVDPFEAELLPNPSALESAKLFLGGSLEKLLPVYVHRSPETGVSAEDMTEIANAILRPLGLPVQRSVRVVTARDTSRWRQIEELLQVAREERASMILVSSHGRAGMGRMVLGSFADALLQQSPIPVWFLPRHGAHELKPRRLLFATDFSDRCREVYHAFLDSARASAEEVILYHVASLPLDGASACASVGALGAIPEGFIETMTENAWERARSWVEDTRRRGVLAPVRPEIDPGCGRIGEGILRFAYREGVSLIGMASRSGPWERTLFGSSVRLVVRDQIFPVWVCGPRWRADAAEPDRAAA